MGWFAYMRLHVCGGFHYAHVFVSLYSCTVTRVSMLTRQKARSSQNEPAVRFLISLVVVIPFFRPVISPISGVLLLYFTKESRCLVSVQEFMETHSVR